MFHYRGACCLKLDEVLESIISKFRALSGASSKNVYLTHQAASVMAAHAYLTALP